MIDLEPIREQWITDRPVYEALAAHIRTMLTAALQHRGLIGSVEARAKDVASLLKKVLRKSYSTPYDQIRDKAGVRIVVAFAGEVEIAEAMIRERFIVDRYENKTLGLEYHELGYLGVHCDVMLREADLERPEWHGLLTEIQIHTKAQNCWADVSHRLLYKADQGAPIEIKRRIYRLMALIELFDDTVQEARKAIEMLPGAPEAKILAELEQHFYKFVGRAYDRELSLDVIGALKGVYDSADRDAFSALIRSFVDKNRDKLDELFAAYRDDDRANPLMLQPEALLIFELLERDPFRLREVWTASFPPALLENLGTIWGRSV